MVLACVPIPTSPLPAPASQVICTHPVARLAPVVNRPSFLVSPRDDEVTQRRSAVRCLRGAVLAGTLLLCYVNQDRNDAVTWGEVKSARSAIEGLVPRDLMTWGGCERAPMSLPLGRRSDGTDVSGSRVARCQPPAQPMLNNVGYTLAAQESPNLRVIVRDDLKNGEPTLAQLDPQHLIRPTHPQPSAAAMPPEALTGDAGMTTPASDRAAVLPSGFFREGIHRIVGGLDHVLFLICLLLPAVGRSGSKPGNAPWRAIERPQQALWPVLGLVTMFTVAHSVTLALASLHGLVISSKVVEPLIAATIVATAVDNVRPFFRLPRVFVTFFFGLIHGMGFAGALDEMGGLPTASFFWALLQFNLGIEFGQVVIVAVTLAVLLALRRVREDNGWYARWALRGGSAAVGGLGVWWLVERLRWVGELLA